MWDSATGEELYRIWHHLDVNSVAFSPDGEYLVTAELGRNREDHRSLRPRGPRPAEDGADSTSRDARFSSDGRLVATAAWFEELREKPREDLGLEAR